MKYPEARERLSEFPERPGIYLLKDVKGRVLYVGKAKSLRDRVASYFRPAAELPRRTRAMLPAVSEIEYLEAPTEVEALLMEARLIKDVQPKYNVLLKDGKSFPLLALSRDDDFPRVYVTRDPAAGVRGNPPARPARLYGPFTEAKPLRHAVQILQGIFRFRTCDLEIREDAPKRRGFRPCLLYHIGRCSAPCAGKIGKADYASDLQRFRQFLSGGRAPVLKALEADMARAAAAREYERAAGLRDQIASLRGLDRRWRRTPLDQTELTPLDPFENMQDLGAALGLSPVPRTIEGIDLAHLGGQEAVGSLVAFLDGIPYKDGYRRFRLKTVTPVDDYASMREVVRRRFSRLMCEGLPFPDLLLLDGGAAHLRATLAEFQALGFRPPVLLALAKHEGDHLFTPASGPGAVPEASPARVAPRRSSASDPQIVPLHLDPRSAGFRLLQFVRDEAHRFAQRYHHFLRSERTFRDVPAPPSRAPRYPSKK
ncbi:MAG: UvrB/UvrC motif-containing protein [Planctomycetes bacterium]|nr:UvrB/UvrC motif-containing protein [Planctomycetota bacterium]